MNDPRRVKYNFERPSGQSNVKVLVDGTTLYVSAEILSLHSHFFRSLYYRPMTDLECLEQPSTSTAPCIGDDDFEPPLIRTDNNKKLVRMMGDKLNDVKHLFLMVYDPAQWPVTDRNVTFIMELADKYHFFTIMDRVNAFLVQKSRLPMEERLDLADKHYQSVLAGALLSLISAKELKVLMKQNPERYSERMIKKFEKVLSANQ